MVGDAALKVPGGGEEEKADECQGNEPRWEEDDGSAFERGDQATQFSDGRLILAPEDVDHRGSRRGEEHEPEHSDHIRQRGMIVMGKDRGGDEDRHEHEAEEQYAQKIAEGNADVACPGVVAEELHGGVIVNNWVRW